MEAKPHIFLLDNYDSFTHMLKDYIEQCGATCLVQRNDKITVDEIKHLKFDAIVISPGPKEPKDAGILMELIEVFHNTTPIFGVCLGHQALGQYFGSNLQKAILPRHGKVDEMVHQNDLMFDGIPTFFNATRYHSLILKNLSNQLIVTCTCGGEFMAFRHKNLPIWGVQFHPESSQTQYGLKLISNFVALVNKKMLGKMEQ